jgi:3-oxoacyl-[acyl-carrier-protein] synthase-3
MDSSDGRILPARSALPGSSVGNTALNHRFGMEQLWEKWIDVFFIGARSRHLAGDLKTEHVGTPCATSWRPRARRALTAGGIDVADIDLMVMRTATPDMLTPATVNNVPAYPSQTGCAGSVQAINVEQV